MTSPYMPLYIADYMADTAHLDTIEHGAYLLLIMTYWQRGKPLVSERLANVCRLDSETWGKIKPAIENFFIVDDKNGVWRHKRLDQELKKFAEKSLKAKENGAKGGRPKKNQTVSSRLSVSLANQKLNESYTDTDTDTDTISPIIPTGDFDALWRSWMPFEMSSGNKKMAEAAYRKSLKKTGHDKILSSAKAYCEDCKRRKSKTQHLVTWLNQEGWANQYQPARSVFDVLDNHARNGF